jgi:CheY-like chemotaxis protein
MPRVLLVDDNEDAAEVLADVLRSEGHTVEIALDGANALRSAPSFRPEVAVLDIGLPRMDGWEVGRQLRQLPGLDSVRLIGLTGFGQEADKQRSEAAGFELHFVKPLDVDRLLAALSRQA